MLRNVNKVKINRNKKQYFRNYMKYGKKKIAEILTETSNYSTAFSALIWEFENNCDNQND